MRFPALWLGALRLAAGALGGHRQLDTTTGDTGDGTTTTTDGLDDATLVAHYTFDDEEVADDQSDVYDYDGTVGGGTFEDGGDGSGALTFDGTDDYVSFPETLTTTLIGSAARTVCLWAVVDTFNGGTLFSYDASADGMRFGFMTETTAGEFGLLGYGGDYDFRNVAVSGSDDGEWHHYCNTYDGSDWLLYVDGTLAHTETVALNTASDTPFTLGRRYTSGWTGYFSGSIDEVYVYSSALDGASIQALYDALGAPSLVPTPLPLPVPTLIPAPVPTPVPAPVPTSSLPSGVPSLPPSGAPSERPSPWPRNGGAEPH